MCERNTESIEDDVSEWRRLTGSARIGNRKGGRQERQHNPALDLRSLANIYWHKENIRGTSSQD
jgi:hypothetical protein